jgi:D-mannonate dehydratase
MYLQTEELNTHIYDYQLQQITESTPSIALAAIEASISEVKSYLATRYNVATIFSAQGSERNALVLDIVKTIAVFRIIKLSNVDILYDKYLEQYKLSIDYLSRIAQGLLCLDLPPLTDSSGSIASGSIRATSNTKFNHYF